MMRLDDHPASPIRRVSDAFASERDRDSGCRESKEIYEFWKRRLRPEGYHIRYEVIDYPGGMPGDIGITLSWHVNRR
jgi:hypothetical protein